MNSTFQIAGLLGLALGSVAPAHAQQQPTPTKPSAPRRVATGKTAATAAPSNPSETVTVRGNAVTSNDGSHFTTAGGGLMPRQTAAKAISGVDRDFITKQAATSSPLALIQNLPGVNFASADALGQSDQATVYIRGLDQTQFGYTYEGIPIADPTAYAPFSSEAADAENISAVDIAQGHSDITTPVYNAVGGEIKQYTIDPQVTPGGRYVQSVGDRRMSREFLRLDTGNLGQSGIRGFVSYSYQYNNLWTGPGINRRSHIDTKWVKEWGNGNRIALIGSWTQSHYNFFDTTTVGRFNGKLSDGSSAAEYDQDFHEPYAPDDSGWWNLNFGDRNSYILGMPSHFVMNPSVSLTVTPYFVHIHGWSDYGVQLSDADYFGNEKTGIGPLPNQGTVLSIDDFSQYTSGFNNVLSIKTSPHNTIDAGYWYSYYDQLETSPFELLDENGNYANAHGSSYELVTDQGQILNNYHVHLISQINSLFLSDTYKMLNDRLTLNAGFKYVMTNYVSTNAIPGDSYNYGRNDAQPVPQVSLSYKLTSHDQIFVDGATGFREPSGILVYGDAWSVTSPEVNQDHSTNLRPEYSISEEVGYRHYGLFNFAIALFNYNFTNRQLSSLELLEGRDVPVSINAGGQTSRGVQAEFGLRPWHHFSPYVSFQYLHATIDNNLARGDEYLPTTGKTSVASPRFSGSVAMSYDDGSFFGNLIWQGVSSQYSTFMNDEQLAGYITANATVGYRLPSDRYLHRPQIQLNMNNITDRKYLSGVAGISTNATDARSVTGTIVNGISPTYNVGGGFGAVVQFSTGF